MQNQFGGIVVGLLITTDPNIGDTFTYALVGVNTALLSLSGDSLRTAELFDYEVCNASCGGV